MAIRLVSFAGTGVAQFSAVFEPQADSAWLKCLILKFYLVAQSSLHEGSPPLSEAESSASYTSGRTHHTLSSTQQQQSIDPAASGTMLPKNKSVNKNRKQKQTSRAPGGARTATDSFQSSPRVPAPQLRQSAGGSQQHNKTKQPSAHSDSTMAVPVASDDSKAVNGFSARAVVDADSSGTSGGCSTCNAWALSLREHCLFKLCNFNTSSHTKHAAPQL